MNGILNIEREIFGKLKSLPAAKGRFAARAYHPCGRPNRGFQK